MKEEKFKSFKAHAIDEYLNKVFEAFNPPLDIKWAKSQNEWIGIFIIDKNEYKINITNYSEKKGNWLFKFSSNGLFDLVGDIRKAFTVLPTVRKAIIDFMDKIDPEVLFFIAADESIGRKNIYSRFCVELSKSRFLNYYTEMHGNTEFFILTKHEYDGVEFVNTVLKVRREYGI